MTDGIPMTTAQVADKLKTDPRTLRRFLRSSEEGVGTGKRYLFDPRSVTALKKQFDAWRAEVEGKEAATPMHTCTECEKEFKSASGLASHAKTHTAEEN